MMGVRTIQTDRSLRAVVALALVLCVPSCTTRTLTLGSPELSSMNVRSYRTRSTVTLRDGSQLVVDRLQVGAEQTRGDLVKQRPAPIGSRSPGSWQKVDEAARALSVASSRVERVVFTTGRGKGSLIGGASGLVIGAGGGTGVGAAVADSSNCTNSSSPGCDGLTNLSAMLVGLAIGASALAILGSLIGLHGLKRTYLIEPAPSFPEVVPMPMPEAAE